MQDDEIKLLDNRTGRVLEGTRLQSGIHQAIETKEKVKKTKESRAMGSVTYQSLFNMFPKIAGMTGTGHQAEDELIETYHVPVVSIPTNKPTQRIDYPDKIYATLPEKLYATIEMVKTSCEGAACIINFRNCRNHANLFQDVVARRNSTQYPYS